MTESLSSIPETVDITNCDREPIHIPGSIQPHGMLLLLAEPDLVVVQISENSDDFIQLKPQEILGKPLKTWLDLEQITAIKKCISDDFNSTNPLKIQFNHIQNNIVFNGVLHRLNQAIILEL